MKYLASITLLVLTTTLLAAATVEERIKAALENAKPKPECACGTSCPCAAGECGDPNCPSLQHVNAPGPIEWAIYRVQYDQAVSQHRPLLIWVGETCPACERQWTEWVHARLSEYDGPSGQVEKGPCLIVGKPDGKGGLDRVATLAGIPSKYLVQTALRWIYTSAEAQVEAALNLGVKKEPEYTNPYIDNPHWPYQRSQTFVPMSPPMMMGGFGGGGGRGGC